jgi:outer membrane protein OmpA-like peptidoglycan-associated protein/tetratricopeptide (TPR) repeat protein
MKKITIKVLFFVAFTGFFLGSCDLMKDVKYAVSPNPLEMHGDSVKVTITAELPEKGIKKKASAEITPMLGSTPLKTITVQGEKVQGNGNVIMYKPGGKITYTDVVKYKPEFENADLTVTGVIKKGTKEKDKVPATKIADGTIITPLLVQKDFKVIMETDNFQRVTEKTFKASINFDKGKSDLRKNEMKDADIFELQNWLAAAETNPKINIKSIDIIGYASPEGEVGKNESLSSDRATTGKSAIMELAKTSKNTKAQTEIYNLSGRGEDYDGFKVELEKSIMDQDEKQLVIRVLEMYKDPVQREAEMRNMAKTFVYLDKNIFPLLRRSEIIVKYDQTGYSDEELVAISKTDATKLTAEELMFTATLVEDMNDKLALYNDGCLAYPLDVRFHNNAGAILYKQGNLTDAGFKFEAANSLQDNPISKNNLGAIAAKNGDKTKAIQLFNSAKGAGSEVEFNLAYYSILAGKYAEAVSKCGSENSFNKALAQLLNGAPDAAIKTIDGSSAKETALGYYLKAVASARMDKVDLVISNVKNAISKDASMKAKAGKDREFLKFKDNPNFSSVVQ